MTRHFSFAALCLCIAAAALPARAQLSYGGTQPNQPSGLSGSHGSGGGEPDQDQDKAGPAKPEAPPAAIPGAVSDPDSPVAPAEKSASEMSPNDALFDAINRGDLTAAKDAMNRGAQLESHNVLGQTPTDASIDLGRNDITFLLLSLRGSAPAPRPSPGAQLVAAEQAKGHKPAKSKAVLQASAHAKAKMVAALGQDRGTPNPQIGFLGF